MLIGKHKLFQAPVILTQNYCDFCHDIFLYIFNQYHKVVVSKATMAVYMPINFNTHLLDFVDSIFEIKYCQV